MTRAIPKSAAPSEAVAPCPSPEEVWDAAHGALPPGRTAALVDHLAVCASCATAWWVAHRATPPAADRR